MTDVHSILLRKTDPFVLDATVGNLQSLSPNWNSSYPLPLEANPATGSTEEDRPFLKTPFNQIDTTKYRSPWKDSSSGDADVLELEQSANEVWDAYRQLYYGHEAVGSVFVRRKGADARGGTPSKAKKGGALEALFGIQKKCLTDSVETARWDSVHTVTIEVPNFDEGTCEYKIKSAVWCRYQPQDVGDVPKAERPPPKPAPKKSKAPSKSLSTKLNVARLEVFDRAANNWDRNGNRNNKGAAPVQDDKLLPPVPAVVTSSAVYTKDTTKVCKLQMTKTQAQSKAIPIASHIQNIGTLLEKIEADFRSKLERVDAPKCVEVLQSMYRSSLSPGLKLSSNSSGDAGMVSKLGGHATGMGVGKGLIGEIALKAKAKGLGTEGTGKSKAMEDILAQEKKKLADVDTDSSPSKAPTTWNQSGLKKSKVSPTNTPPRTNTGTFARPNLRKANSVRLNTGSSPDKEAAASAVPSAGFLKRPNLRKAVSVRTFDASSTPAPTPEFMNFRSKLKSTAAK